MIFFWFHLRVIFQTECKLFIQHLVLDNDCCISRNVARTEINLVMSNNLYFLFSFLTWSRLLDFTFAEEFSIWKSPFASQILFQGSSVAKYAWIWYLPKDTLLHFSLKYEFGNQTLSQLQQWVFRKKFYFYLLKTDHF